MPKFLPNSNKTRIWTLKETIRPAGLFWGFTVFIRWLFWPCFTLIRQKLWSFLHRVNFLDYPIYLSSFYWLQVKKKMSEYLLMPYPSARTKYFCQGQNENSAQQYISVFPECSSCVSGASNILDVQSSSALCLQGL